jgi:hypothetical protein
VGIIDGKGVGKPAIYDGDGVGLKVGSGLGCAVDGTDVGSRVG